ncbi:oxamate carbamoyltransferase subunit AllG family protein, partial [Streptococcus salivarius]
MPVHIVENRTNGNRAYCSVNEGLGKVLRFGAFSDSVLERLRWIEKEFAPVLNKAIGMAGGVDLKLITAQAV